MASRSKRRISMAEKAEEKPAEKSRVTPLRSESQRKRAALGELGASGTIIQSGMLRAESNAKLLHTLAYGNPGSPQWGEWQKLLRTDPAVATALNKVVAPLRDSKFEVEPAEVRKPKGKEKPEAGKSQKIKADKTADISDKAVAMAYALSQGADRKGFPYEWLHAWFDAHPKVVQAAIDRAEEHGIFDYGVSQRTGWLTENGKALAEEGFDEDPEAKDVDPEVEEEGEGEDPEEEHNQVIADFVSDCFNKKLTPTMGMHIEQVVKGGLAYGFALHEIVFGVCEDDRVPGGQAYYLRKMAQRLPNSIMQNGWIEKDGELVAIRQQGYVDGQWVTVELPADRVQLATWDRDGNNYAGFSAFRSVWYLGILRAELLRILGIGHQREACGTPVAMMDKDVRLTDPERDALQEILETVSYHENAGFQLPPGVTVDWFFSPGANKGSVLETWRQLGIAILQVVGAEDSELGMGEAGTRSLGETKAAARNGFIEGVRSWLEGVFNGIGEWQYTGVVKKLVDANFGPQKEYPRLKLVTPKADMPIAELANAAKTLSDAGAIHFTADDEDDFRERLGMKQIDPAVREQLAAQKEAAKAAQMEALKAAKGDSTPPAKDDEEKSNAKARMLAELMGEE